MRSISSGGSQRSVDCEWASHGVDEVRVHALEAAEVGLRPSRGTGPHGGAGGVLHALDVGVDLWALDALEVVADRHVEDEAVRVSQTKLAGKQLAGPPGLDVLAHGLRDLELGGPLAVVALVLGDDAGLGHATGEFLAVHHLDGLELEEAGTRNVGGHDVLRKAGAIQLRPDGSRSSRQRSARRLLMTNDAVRKDASPLSAFPR